MLRLKVFARGCSLRACGLISKGRRKNEEDWYLLCWSLSVGCENLKRQYGLWTRGGIEATSDWAELCIGQRIDPEGQSNSISYLLGSKATRTDVFHDNVGPRVALGKPQRLERSGWLGRRSIWRNSADWLLYLLWQWWAIVSRPYVKCDSSCLVLYYRSVGFSGMARKVRISAATTDNYLLAADEKKRWHI